VIQDPEEKVRSETVVQLAARAGEVILIHNHLWHCAGINRTGRHRRTVSVCYVPASTRCLRKRRAPRRFFRAFAGEAP